MSLVRADTGEIMPSNNHLSREQIDLIKKTVAKDATDLELQFFVARCDKTQLDPLSHQIWFTKRKGVMSIQTGIDGYRLIGDRTGRYAGQDGPWWCGKDGQWVDVWLRSEHPEAARVVVKKVLPTGDIGTFPGVALWAEYGDNADGFMWKKMPAGQLAKCAEALALRKAFPQEMSGIYVREEMDQAGPQDRPVREITSAPPPVQSARLAHANGPLASDEERQAIHARLKALKEDNPEVAKGLAAEWKSAGIPAFAAVERFNASDAEQVRALLDEFEKEPVPGGPAGPNDPPEFPPGEEPFE